MPHATLMKHPLTDRDLAFVSLLDAAKQLRTTGMLANRRLCRSWGSCFEPDTAIIIREVLSVELTAAKLLTLSVIHRQAAATSTRSSSSRWPLYRDAREPWRLPPLSARYERRRWHRQVVIEADYH